MERDLVSPVWNYIQLKIHWGNRKVSLGLHICLKINLWWNKAVGFYNSIMGKAFKSLLGPQNISLTLLHLCFLIRCVSGRLYDHTWRKGRQRPWIRFIRIIVYQSPKTGPAGNITILVTSHSKYYRAHRNSPKPNALVLEGKEAETWVAGDVRVLVPHFHSSEHWGLNETSRNSCKPGPELTV